MSNKNILNKNKYFRYYVIAKIQCKKYKLSDSLNHFILNMIIVSILWYLKKIFLRKCQNQPLGGKVAFVMSNINQGLKSVHC